MILVASALAATVALHDGEAPARARRVVARTEGVSPSEVTVATLPQLLASSGAPMVAGAELGRCPRAGAGVTNADLEALVKAAEGPTLLAVYHEAIPPLDLAISRIPCLTEAPSVELLADLYFLRGVVGYYSERGAVEPHFRNALALRPDLGWDDRYADVNGQVIFDRVRAAPAVPTPLTVLHGAGFGVLVDGAALEGDVAQVAAGVHVVQLTDGDGPPVMTVTVEVLGGSPAVLFFPMGVGAHALRWIFEEDTRSASAGVLARLRPDGDTLVALSPGTLARLEGDPPGWALRPTARFPSWVGNVLLVGGGVLLVGGGIGAATSYAEMSEAAATRPTSLAEDLERTRRLEAAEAVVVPYVVGTAIGTLSAGLGVTVELVDLPARRARSRVRATRPN